MCDLTLGIAALSGLMSYNSQNEMAQAQMDAGAESHRLMLEQIQEKQRQINQQNTLEQSERNKQGMIERAQVATIAGESGALGFSADRLIGESFMSESLDIASLETNRGNAIKQTEYEKKASGARYNSTVNIAKSNQGNLISTGLQIAGDYSRAQRVTKAKTTQKTGG